MNIEDLPPRYQQQALIQLAPKNKTTVSAANAKQNPGDEPLAKKEVKKLNGQVSVSVHSKRKRLTDSDGAFAKYVIDAIVTAGVLPDDSPEFIPESPKKTQEKTKDAEETIIEIYRA